MEKEIKIAAKLCECRDTARRFFKEDYFERLRPYTDLIKTVMKANKENELEALLRISKTNAYNSGGMAQMMFMAAAVELAEPSPPENK